MNKLDICDIPIALITSQYLQYIEMMQELNLEIAGEFLVMAATLIYIKSRMLLPPDEETPDEEVEDPRAELVKKLLEYQKFKEAAGDLRQREEDWMKVFRRDSFLAEEDLLRTRRIGGRALVDVHIIVDDDISVSEGHYISEIVRTRLVEEVDVVADALVHIDPEDDVHSAPARALPSRSAVQARLKEAFRDIPAAAGIERVVLHYVGGRLRVEVVLPLAVVAGSAVARQLADRLRAALAQDALIDALEVRFE